MATPYTVGIWNVKPDKADEFVAAWTEFAEWTRANIRGTTWVKLLRDRGDRDRFVSVGPWDSLDAIEVWRADEGWTMRVGQIRELLAGFEAMTLETAVELD